MNCDADQLQLIFGAIMCTVFIAGWIGIAIFVRHAK